MMKNKALRNLGIIKQSCTSFRDPLLIKIVFELEYCPFIWTNNNSKQIKAIESIQNNFLRIISFNFNIYRSPRGSYRSVLKCIHLSPLKNETTLLLSTFLHNLLLGNINCSELFFLICSYLF